MNMRLFEFRIVFLVVAVLQVCGDIRADESLLPLGHGNGWKLIWSDEFDGKEIDRLKWNVTPDSARGMGFWSSDNVALDGSGHIVFKVTRRGEKVVGAGIDTYRKFATTGGFFTFRCKLSPFPGYRPAIWITSKSVEQVGNEGRDGTEIDVMEQPGRRDNVHLNLHWDGYGKDHKTTGVKAGVKGQLDDWHVFSVMWMQDEYIFYVDGEESWRTSDGGVSQVDELIKMGIEVPWVFSEYRKSEFSESDVFVCDYARVYKKE